MNGYASFAGVIGRIAAATSALRVRADDVARHEHNGGSTAELQARIETLVGRLEQVAADLEDALA